MHDVEMQNLFGTPIWTFQLGDQTFNDSLQSEGAAYTGECNFFNLPGESIAQLKRTIKDVSEKIAKQYQWNSPISLIRGRQHPIFPGECESAHHHLTAKLIAVYYVSAGPKQGDILLHDPRGSTNWVEPLARTEEKKTMRAFHRITPKPGMLLVFPGYLIHSVETNLSDTVRLSIAVEVFLEPPKD